MKGIESYDARAFNAAIDTIVRTTGVPVREVVRHESARLLETAVKDTYAATAGSIAKSYERTRRGDKGKLMEAAKRARGLAKQAWLALGQAAGLAMKVPGFVRKAEPTTGQRYDNASVRTEDTGRKAIHFETRQPTLDVPTVQGRRVIHVALGKRAKFFRVNLEKRVFESLQAIGKRYPGLTVRR
jgi:hypothetical protein